MIPSHPSTARRTLTAFGSLAIAFVLLVGVPLALWRLAGWPLPATMPTPDDVARAMSRSSVSDIVIIKTLALLGWCAWTLLVFSVVVEVWARLSGRPSPSIRFVGPFQDLARRLVTAASLLTVTGTPLMGAGPALASIGSPALVVERSPQTPAPAPSVVTPRLEAGADNIPSPLRYTVQRRDSLWRIAECQLGDPMRWREIWDLNRGRDFGGVEFNDANLIRPGWELDLPQASKGAASPSAPELTPPGNPAAPTSEPAEDAATTPTTTTTVAVASSTSSPSTSLPAGPEAADDRAMSDDGVDDQESTTPMFLGGVALATGLLLALRRLRRTQGRRRRPGTPPHRPPAESNAIETAIRHDAEINRMERAFVALRAFARGIGDGTPLPHLAAARVGSQEIEILLGSAAPTTPPGFEDRGEQRAFATEPSVSTDVLTGLAAETATPWPALVSIGGLNDDLVMIDLETAGILAVGGRHAGDAVRRIAAELAVSPAADLVDVLVLGSDPGLAFGERVRKVPNAAEALAALGVAVRSTRTALDLLGVEDTPTARRRYSDEQAWGVTVLVCSEPLAAADLDRLQGLLQPRSGIAVVMAGEPVAMGWSLTVDDEAILGPHDLRLSVLGLQEEDVKALDSLLADAAVGDAEAALLGAGPLNPDPVEPIYVPDTVAAATEGDTSDHDVEIRVLGPVEIHGAAPINRRRTAEVIVYLALHGKGVTASQLKTALWPDSMPSQDTFNVTIHRARATLGLDRDGAHHLPHAVTNGNGYSVGSYVTSDLDRFNNLVARSRTTADPGEEAQLLREALTLLRGQPFEGVRGYEWAYTEGIVVEAEATIADTAHRLAQLALADGDAALATWAATQGLMAVPGSEPLYRDRMEAAHLNGDPAAVDRIVDELCRYIETLDPLDDLHPDTIELWHRIGRSATGPPSAS